MQQDEQNTADLAAALLDRFSSLLARVRKDLSTGGTILSSDNEEPQEAMFTATPVQFKFLRILLTQNRSTMQSLATHLGVTPPTVTGLVKRLLAQKYVQRIHDDADWRNIWIEITPQGRQAVIAYDQQRVAVLQRRIEHLSPEEQVQLQAILPVFSHILEECV
jgi:MarR family transcriptional regulator, organic hydroperoxide resistance regulator